MNPRRAIKAILATPPLVGVYARYLSRRSPKSQTDESVLLRQIVGAHNIPRSFVEFGFHAKEFNCSALTGDFDGLLIDGNHATVALATSLLPRKISAVNRLLDLDNLNVILDYCEGKPFGVLSVDVDGNDCWFVERLIALKPAVIVAEYNASLGLRPITVPYSPIFDRHAEHKSGWYHGASLTALHGLCASRGYSLAAVSAGGCNAFFLRNDLKGSDLAPASAYRKNTLRNQWSKSTAAQQWEADQTHAIHRKDRGRSTLTARPLGSRGCQGWGRRTSGRNTVR